MRMGTILREMRAVFGDNLPKFTDAEKKLLKGSADFFGLNHYSTGWYSATEEPGWDMTYGVSSEDGFIRAQSTWLYGAGWGLRKLLNWVKRRYNPVIYVTENGWSIGAIDSSLPPILLGPTGPLRNMPARSPDAKVSTEIASLQWVPNHDRCEDG